MARDGRARRRRRTSRPPKSPNGPPWTRLRSAARCASLLRERRIVRQTARANRRRSLLRLSAAGRKVYAPVVPVALDYERDLLAPLPGRIVQLSIAQFAFCWVGPRRSAPRILHNAPTVRSARYNPAPSTGVPFEDSRRVRDPIITSFSMPRAGRRPPSRVRQGPRRAH